MRKGLLVGALVLGVMSASWLLPPIFQKLLGLCPMRPEPMRTASAVPAFSRKYGYSCTQCHNAFPLLNSFGRAFKLNGYVATDEGILKSADGQLWTEKLFPISAVIRSRPFDNGTGSVSNAGAGSGGSNGSNGFKMEPVNDVDMFIAGGDVARHISWFGELDANVNNFTPSSGDLVFGYHPLSQLNFYFARKNFYAMDPYQTLAGMMSPTVANRAIDGIQADQNGLSGNILTEQTQTIEVFGQVENDKLGSLYYAAGASTQNGDNIGQSNKNGNFRLAFDTLKGLMVGGFGTYGRENPATIPANGGTANPPGPGNGSQVQFIKTGFDALAEMWNFVARGAFLYSYDGDPMASAFPGTYARLRDRAAYAELMYLYKRGGSDLPFLVPLIRENWYTTYNGTRQFNYITAQLAHYFTGNVKAFVEYSVDTKSDLRNVYTPPQARAPLGRRVTGQIEFGF